MNFDELKAQALADPKKRSRIILVPGFDMIICLHKSSYVRYHRHPKYEAYHVLEGRLEVEFETDKEIPPLTMYFAHGGIWKAGESPFVCIPPRTWHEPRAHSEFVIYREFYCGPFEKARDVEYATWAKAEAA